MAPVRVEYWEKWGGAEWEAMAALVHSFNTAQHLYEVVMVPAGDWSSSPDLPRFLRALDKGTPPDLIGLEDRHIVDLAAAGALLPLFPDLDPGQGREPSFQKEFLELGIYDGKLHGMPISADIVTLYVNLRAVEGTTFEGGRIPADLSQFDVGLEELRARGKIGFVPTYPGWWPQAWPWFFGGSWFDVSGQFTPNRLENVRAYEWVASLRHRWGLRTFAEPINPIGAGDPDPFLVGDVAMVFEGDWLVQRLTKVSNLTWLPAAFPTVERRPAALVCADLLSIPTGARQPEGAAEFIRFATRPEAIERLALGHRKISPLACWSEGFVLQHPNPRLGVLREIFRSARLFHNPRVPGWLRYLDRINQAFRSVWTEGVHPSQALAAIRDDG